MDRQTPGLIRRDTALLANELISAQAQEIAALKSQIVTVAKGDKLHEDADGNLQMIAEEIARTRKERDANHAHACEASLEERQLRHALAAKDEEIARLKKALETIADPPGDATDICNCTHETEDCCARVNYHCPQCIAAAVLSAQREETT